MMNSLGAFINLFFPSCVSVLIYHGQMKKERWSFEDLAVYGIFVVLNLFVTNLIIDLIERFGSSTDISWDPDEIWYTGLALAVSIVLAYGRVIVQMVFHGSVEVEKK